MEAELKKPPPSPPGNVSEWRRQSQEYVNASWDRHRNGATNPNEAFHEIDEPDPVAQQVEEDEDTSDGSERDESEVEGNLRPLIDEGEHTMVCIGYELQETRFGQKDYLRWRESNGSPILEQFFTHYEKYPVNSKAVENYLVAMGKRPDRLDRLSWRKFIGLKAVVYVETVKPTYANGGLKGRSKPEVMHYSKVSQILRPVGHVDPNTLRESRKKP